MGRRGIASVVSMLVAATWMTMPVARADALKDITRKFYRQMQQDCREFGGKLKVNWKKFEYRGDITGDGKEDLIWHATPDAVQCSGAVSIFCGTGGCSMLVVVNRRKDFEFLAQGWSLGRLNDGTRLLFIDIHWAECNYAAECRRILRWNPSRQTFDPLGLLWRPQQEE